MSALIGLVSILFAQPTFGQVTTSFRYDAMGRLVRAFDSEGRAVIYKCDAAGNRISLGSGAAPGEIVPKAFSGSSNGGGFTGLVDDGAMRDLTFDTPASAHITLADSLAWVQADLGASKTIDHIDQAAPGRALSGGGVGALNSAQVQYSQDAFNWNNGRSRAARWRASTSTTSAEDRRRPPFPSRFRRPPSGRVSSAPSPGRLGSFQSQTPRASEDGERG